MLNASAERAWVLEHGTVRRLDASDKGEEGRGKPLADWIAAEVPAGVGLAEAVAQGLADARPFSVNPVTGSERWRFVPVLGESPSEQAAAARDLGVQRGSETLWQVRNTLAVVRAIIRRSASPDDGSEAFAQRLEERIGAVARVRGALARGAAPDLEMVLRDELKAVQADEGRLSVEGPRVRLPVRVAETLALAFHELAVNAIEHGALSEPDGRVEVTWEVVTPSVEARWLRLAWSESGGPERLALGRRGFGTDVIEHMLPYDVGALTAFTLGAHGLTCRMEIPLSKDQDAEGASLS